MAVRTETSSPLSFRSVSKRKDLFLWTVMSPSVRKSPPMSCFVSIINSTILQNVIDHKAKVIFPHLIRPFKICESHFKN